MSDLGEYKSLKDLRIRIGTDMITLPAGSVVNVIDSDHIGDVLINYGIGYSWKHPSVLRDFKKVG